MTIDKYLDKLAARSPVPGGGSAAALVGAIGMSLLSMVARYISKKGDRGASYRKLHKILEFTERSRRHLKKLMGEDEAAYLRLSKGIKRGGPKDITKLYKSAAEVPLEVCTILQEGLKKCEELCSYCKTPLVSDLTEAALLLEVGFMSTKLNVDINLAGIKDSTYTKRVKRTLLRRKKIVLRTKKRILKRWQRV